jgi:putative nucleotidyltransferase with HDIG domain
MKDKTKEQLIKELVEMRQQIAELEASEAQHKRAEAKLRHSLKKWRKTTNAIIHAMEKIPELKGFLDHGRRVAKLACAIAEEMGLSEERIEVIYVAGILHNIGKMYIPAEILNKTRALSRNGRCIIKTVPQISYEILKTIEFPSPVAQIVFQHHERMDGSGHPLGVLGKEILLEARILGVASVVGGMTSDRPNQPVLGIDEILKIISKNRGILYDPEVVHGCLKLFTEKGFKLE